MMTVAGLSGINEGSEASANQTTAADRKHAHAHAPGTLRLIVVD